MIGWKKVILNREKAYKFGRSSKGACAIVKLETSGMIASAGGPKMRCECATVLAMYRISQKEDRSGYVKSIKLGKRLPADTECESIHDDNFKYRAKSKKLQELGYLIPSSFERSFTECAPGIHFFADVEHALNY